MFPQLFRVLQTSTSVSVTREKTENMFSVSFRKYMYRVKKGKQIVYFDHQNVNSLFSGNLYVSASSVFSV